MNTSHPQPAGNASSPAPSDIKNMSAEEVLALMEKDLGSLKKMSGDIDEAYPGIADFDEAKPRKGDTDLPLGLEAENEKMEVMSTEIDERLNAALNEFAEAEEKKEAADAADLK